MSIYRIRTEFGHHLKWLMAALAVVFIIGAIFTFGAAPGSKNRQDGGRNDSEVVATVNGLPIVRGDFENVWARASEEARNQGIRSPLQYADYRSAIFGQMVQSRLVLSAAKKLGVDISNRKVNEAIDEQVVKNLIAYRESILGSEMTKNERKLDPRNDSKFKSELASIGRSIGEMEDAIRAQVPEEDVRAKLAYDGIQKKIEQGVKHVTEQDVKDSYNVYKVRQIVFMKGMMPEDQQKMRIDKIMEQVRSGADFAKLAKGNTQGLMPNSRSEMEYSFDSHWSVPVEVREAIEKLKPGGVSSPIKSNYGTFIVKLESITPKLPTKMDQKTIAARRRQIVDDRKMTALMALQTQMQGVQVVKVTDPELRAYWLMAQSRQAFTDPAKSIKLSSDAIASLKKARADRLDNRIITAKLAQLLYEKGKTKEGLDLLYPMLEGANATDEGADLRILLGDMMMAQAAKEKPEQKAATIAKVIEQYKIAGEVARNEKGIHEQLVTKYQQLKQPELVAAEQKWIKDYDLRVKVMQTKEQQNAPKSKSAVPKAGG